jgi:hypothetical protein
MPDIGWVELTAADTFFSTRYGCSAWAPLKTEDRTALLTTAWNRILYDPRWTIPASPDATQKAKLAYAQELTAWYMYTHLEDEERRKGLQAQGVVGAGIVKETYDTGSLDKIPLPAEALGVLESLFVTAKSFYAVDIDRKESCSVDADVVETDDSLIGSGSY